MIKSLFKNPLILKNIKIDFKSTYFFFFWSSIIFTLGIWCGFNIPNENHESVREYAIMLEESNSLLNKNLNLCKSQSTMIKLISSGDKEEKKREQENLIEK
tara:strand:- start:252 stop:554 length:303 start_codon:yes stop_codon:yes gene_type:complete